MELDDALRMLGLDRTTTWADIRAAYRVRIRAVHPDLTAGSGADAAQLNAAFAVLEPVYRRGVPPPPPTAAPAPPPAEVAHMDDDSLALVAPPDEVFFRLAAAIDEMGAITYADPDGGYLEALVADGTGQLVVSLQGRAHATEAFFTLEQLDSRPTPPIDTVVREIAARLRGRAARTRED
jgi:hypothetical protein